MKKFTAFIIALTIVLSMILVAPIGTAAQVIDNDTVSDDVDKLFIRADDVYYEVEKGQTFTYQYCLSVDSAKKIASFSATTYFDTEGLDFIPEFDEYGDFDVTNNFPKISNYVVYNYNIAGQLKYNFSNLNGVRIGENCVMFSGVFTVTADSGVYDIYTTLETLGDTDNKVLFAAGEKYGEFDEFEICPDLTVSENMTSTPTDESTADPDRKTVYLVNTAWPGVAVFADVSSSTSGKTNSIYMYRVDIESPNGADVCMAYIDGDYDLISFRTNGDNKTDITELKDGWYYDNSTNKWYENLSDVPDNEDISSEEPSSEDITMPDVEQTTVEQTQIVTNPTEDTGLVYIRMDGVYYEAKKGQTFTYRYCLSVDYTRKISSLDVAMFYDTDGLDFLPYLDEYGDLDTSKVFPKIGDNVVYNDTIDGQIRYTYSNISGVRLADKDIVFESEFKVTADSGVYDIYSTLNALGDSNQAILYFQGIKYDEYEEFEIIRELVVSEEMTSAPTQEPTADTNRKIVYLINSERWHQSGIYACASGNGTDMSVYMRKIAKVATNGAEVFVAYIDGEYDTVYFKNIYGEKTPVAKFMSGWYYDNTINRWYENLDSRPAVDPTEQPTTEEDTTEELSSDPPTNPPPSEDESTYPATTDEEIVPTGPDGTAPPPTQEPTTEDSDVKPGTSDGIYIKVDTVLYPVQKGDIFTYGMTLTYTQAKISSIDVNINYDTDGLAFRPVTDEYGDVDALAIFPITGYSTVYNFNKSGQILFNYSSVSGSRFTKPDSLVFCGQFEVTADEPGVYELNGVFKTLADTNLNRIVYDYQKLKDYDTHQHIYDIVPSDPTIPPVETDPPTKDPSESDSEVSTNEPATDDVVEIEYCVVAGDGALFGSEWDPSDRNNELTLNSDGTYSKVYKNISAGLYEFKVTINGQWGIGEYNLEGDALNGGANALAEVLEDNATVIIGFDGTKATLVIDYPKEDPSTEPPTFDPSQDSTEETSEPIPDASSTEDVSTDVPSTEAPSSSEEIPSGDESSEDDPTQEPPSDENSSEEEPSQPTDPDDPIDPDDPVIQLLLGDLDFNGKVQVIDATIIQRMAAKYDQLTDEQKAVADTNKDGVVNVLDATMIQRLVAKFITEF